MLIISANVVKHNNVCYLVTAQRIAQRVNLQKLPTYRLDNNAKRTA